MRNLHEPATGCPCGSAKAYATCCGRYIEGAEQADTAEALMRSRYVAYVNANDTYLLQSWYSATRPAELNLHASQPDKWLGLKIVQTAAGGQQDSEGEVEFIARYKLNGKAYRLHEKSRFRKENGLWYYVDGELFA